MIPVLSVLSLVRVRRLEEDQGGLSLVGLLSAPFGGSSSFDIRATFEFKEQSYNLANRVVIIGWTETIDQSRMTKGIGWCLIIMAAWVHTSYALNVSAFEKIGDAPSDNGFVLYVNGSVFSIVKDSNVMQEFDLARKRWMPNRDYKSIKRDGFSDDYFALGSRPFAVLIPDNISDASNASYPSFFFWDKDAGEFQSLPIVVDPSAMPSLLSNSSIRHAIGVPDRAGSDMYFAIVNRGSPTSDAVFSKLHVEFDARNVPIKGELKAFHRATLPDYNSVQYLVLRENVLYWFLRTLTPIKDIPRLDPNYGYYFDFNNDKTGNISTTVSNGLDMFPDPDSYLIGVNHVWVPGHLNPKPNANESEWPYYFQPVWWTFEFGPNQWTAINDSSAEVDVRGGSSVDAVNRVLYLVSPKNGDLEAAHIGEAGPTFINGNVTYNQSATSDGFVFSNDKLYHMTKGGDMSIFELTSKQWTFKNFTPIDKKNDSYSYFALQSTIFLAVVNGTRVGDNWNLTTDVYSWNEAAGQFGKVATYNTSSPVVHSHSEFYMAATVPDPNGNVTYLALTVATQSASEVLIVRMEMRFGVDSSMEAQFTEIQRSPLKGPEWLNVVSMAVNNKTLYLFCRGWTTGIKFWLDFNTTRTIDLETNHTKERPSAEGHAELVDMWDLTISIGKRMFMIGRQIFHDGPSDIRMWSFNTDDNRWTMEEFRLPSNDFYNMFAFDIQGRKLYMRPMKEGGFYVVQVENALNISTFEKIGDPPPPINSFLGFALYVNGSLYDIGTTSSIMMEFDVATKQWAPNRSFKSIKREGFNDDYFALGNRVFAVLVPVIISNASKPLFFYWDKDAGEFKSLTVVVDSSATPSPFLAQNKKIEWAIGVPDKAGSDAYFAIVNRGWPTSDAAFSKLHVEFNGSVPSHGELKGFHRATLPAYSTVQYLVLNKDVVYWFLQTGATLWLAPILDYEYGYYYNLTSNEAGNMSISTSDGSEMLPDSESYLIGDDHIFAFGSIYKQGNDGLQPVFWFYEFASRQWTPVDMVNSPIGVGYGYTVDMVNRSAYIVLKDGVVKEAKINV